MSAESIGTMVVNGLLSAGANVSLLAGSYWIARYGFKRTGGLGVGLATALLFWVACTTGLEILGSFGAITPGAMLVWGAIVGGVGFGISFLGAETADDHSTKPAVGPLSWDAVLCVSLLLSTALILGMKSLFLGVKVVSDGPIYHLYFAARWWKAGRLFFVASPFGENAATYFPANGDLWFTWLMTSWGGDRLAKVGQAPFLVLAGAAAYACARRLGAGRAASLVATCWFASSSPLLIFSFEPNVDTIFVAGYLLSAYFFASAAEGAGDTAACWLGALSARGGAWDQGRRGCLRPTVARRSDARESDQACTGSHQSPPNSGDLAGPACFRGILVCSQCPSDGKSAVSAGGQAVRPNAVAWLVSSPGDGNESLLRSPTKLAGVG